MKKLLMMCSALAIVASSSDAAVRVATEFIVSNPNANTTCGCGESFTT